MAFHVACPITRRRICFCSIGFPHGGASKDGFLEEVFRIHDFLEDPWGNGRSGEKSGGGGISTVQVSVPRVEPPPPPPAAVIGGNAAAEEAAQTKRVVLQRKAAAVTVAAEDYARRFELGDLMDTTRDPIGDKLIQSNGNVMCRICFSGENEGSEKARKMLSCKTCGKKYHRSCLKNWGQHRDLFHWSSWTCPSCRTCEVCRRTGDPNKFMYCRRCDGAYHCYCQQPPHKNVSSGPYLCPKHTKCHSCGSNVPGNGLSVRWFLGYTCCDACGRLFVKGNYCPVCLKVYRDSESTPMVCCDVCERWVHCQCDGISDEKYMQFQVDGNLQYKCATCRSECYQVKDLEDAVHELWRRKDIADQDLIASLRAAAGLPTQEGAFSISPYSDDEESGLSVLKNEFGRSIKFTLKGLVDKSPMKIKEYGNKSSIKPKRKGHERSSISEKEPRQILEGQNDVLSSGHSFDGDNNDNMQSPKNEEPHRFSPVAGSPSHGLCFINQPGGKKHKFVHEVVVSDENRISKGAAFKNMNPFCLDSGEDDEKISSKSKAEKTKKLVINLGSRKINLTQSPMSDASISLREQDLMVSNGHEESNHQRIDKLTADRRDSITNNSVHSKGDTVDYSSQVKGMKLSGNRIKLGKVKPNWAKMCSETDDNCSHTPVSNSLAKESKLSLKFKIRNPQVEKENSTVPGGEEERSFIKGQRSKRKRPSLVIDRSSLEEDQNVPQSHDDMAVDARILKRLGRESIGKVVEVHQSADDSWHRGVVTDVTVGTSKLSVTLDNGRVRTLELEKQGVRFAPQKQKRLKH